MPQTERLGARIFELEQSTKLKRLLQCIHTAQWAEETGDEPVLLAERRMALVWATVILTSSQQKEFVESFTDLAKRDPNAAKSVKGIVLRVNNILNVSGDGFSDEQLLKAMETSSN